MMEKILENKMKMTINMILEKTMEKITNKTNEYDIAFDKDNKGDCLLETMMMKTKKSCCLFRDILIDSIIAIFMIFSKKCEGTYTADGD